MTNIQWVRKKLGNEFMDEWEAHVEERDREYNAHVKKMAKKFPDLY